MGIASTTLSVRIGLPHGPTFPQETTFSLLGTLSQCLTMGIPFGIAHVSGSSIVTDARNRVVDKFLKTDASRLFWIDSDMQWKPDDFVRLLALTTEVDVVCAAYAHKTDKCELSIKHKDLRTFDLHKHGLVKIDGAGLGFCCMKREVVEKVVETKRLVYDGLSESWMADVFRTDTHTDNEGRERPRGEDMAFFADIIELGYDVWLDPTICLGHVGSKVYSANPIEALRLKEVFQGAAVS